MPPRIEANPQVQQELQSRGVTDAVGVFGNHQVRIGQGTPVRLDRIRSAPIPFAGFSRATKIERGRAGVDKMGGDALRQLARPGGRLDAGALLGDLKALRAQLNRLNQLGQIAPPPQDAILRAYAPLVQNLSNEELAAVFQSFTSAEMDLLQTGLRHEAANGSADARKMLSDLSDLQALVTKEVSDRVARDMMANDTTRPEAERHAIAALPTLSESFGPLLRTGASAPRAREAAPASPHIATANVLTLAERSAGGATARERMGADFAHHLEANALPSLSARAMGDVLRAAPLTMNINTDFLLGGSPLMTRPNGQVQNYHHLVRDVREGTRTPDSLPGGMGYIAPRDAVETLLFPELGEHGTDNPDARPTYAALNVNRSETGAATITTYGGSYVVFRPEVAQRATYMADDTFYAIPASFTAERRENFYNRLAALSAESGLPPSFFEEARDPASELHHAFEAYFDRIAADPQANISSLSNLPENIATKLNAACTTAGISQRDGENYMRGALIASFGDGEQARARTATYDSLETLLPGMATPAFNSLARAAIDGHPIVGLTGTNYIEAQIQGGIVPQRDVAEIRVNLGEIRHGDLPAARARAEEFTRSTGIPVTFFNPDERAHMLHQDEVMAAVGASNDFNQAGHWNRDRLSAEVGAIRGNPQAAIDRLLANPYGGLDQLPEGVRNLQGNALNRALAKFENLVQEWARNPPADRQLMSENSLVSEAFNAVFTPLLNGKAALLAELDTLHFDNNNAAQKAAFTNWVMSAQALSSPAELRLVHANATRQAAVLRELADAAPPLSPGEAMKKFSEAMRQGMEEMAAFYQSQVEAGVEFGAEDKASEINRIAFMSLALLRHTEGGEEALKRLAGQLTSPEHRVFAGQMMSLELAAHDFGLQGEDAREPDLLAATNLLMRMIRYNLCSETDRTAAEATPFIGELSLLPRQAREAVEGFAPRIAEELKKTHPAHPAFPAPANPEALPQNEADRRQFLVDLLHPGGTYVAHEMSFERGTSVHGRGHIARAWIFAEAMCNILGEMGVEVDRNAVLCGIAGHDMGRQGGGRDRWEGRSAQMLSTAMGASYGAENLGAEYQREVESSIDAHHSQTLEGLLLNAADSLDIGRTTDFDPEHFAFLRGRPGETMAPQAARMRQQLAREADFLQRLTDPMCQARPALSHLTRDAMDTPHLAETLMEQRAQITEGVAGAYAQRWNESGEDYLRSVESAIRMNPDLFPVLSRYYTQPMGQADAPALPANAERINAALQAQAAPAASGAAL